MSLVNGKHQAAWFGTGEEPEAEAEGSFAGIVFNRPIDRVFTYRVPPRLRRGVAARPAGPRPPGPGQRAGGRLLREPRREGPRGRRPAAGQGRRSRCSTTRR